ncbi:MAG: VWA domain-containing protein [Blastocatellia bacterium]
MSFLSARRSPGILILKSSLIVVVLGAMTTIVAALNPQDKPSTQQQEPSLRLKAELVEIRVVVTDRKGNIVRNLNKEDFEVFENDQGEVVSFFSAENLSTADNQPPTGETRAPAAATPGRTIVFFVDTLHLSTTSLLQTRETLSKFINQQLTEHDVAAVVTSSGSLGIFGQFTQDKQVLRTAISRLSASPETRPNTLYSPYLASKVENESTQELAEIPPALEVAMSIVRAEEGLSDDPHVQNIVKSIALSRAREIIGEATYRRRSTLLTLKAVAERLSDMPGQRLIMMLSDGFTMLDNAGAIDSTDIQSATSRASRSGVVIYTFGAGGLRGLSFFDAAKGGRLNPDPKSANKILSYVSAGDRELEGGLRILAKETGGESFLTTNDLNGALEKAVDDNSFYYALSYYPEGNDNKKTFRRIKVRVKNHPEYRVRTQSGYLAADINKERLNDTSDPQKRLLQAMNSPFAYSQIGIDLSADFLDLQADSAQVSLHTFTDGKKLRYVEENNSLVSKLTILVEVINARGKAESITQDAIQIRLSPEQYKEAGQNVYRQVKRLQLRPGLYQIRVGVRDQATDLIGTSMAWVEVPDLKSKKLALSGISLALSQSANALPQAEIKKTVTQPVIKRGISIFRAADYLTYFSRAYSDFSNEKRSNDLRVRAQIVQGEKVVLEDDWRLLSSLVTDQERNSVEFGGQFGLKTLPAGVYELRIMISDQQSKQTAVQAKMFEIQP